MSNQKLYDNKFYLSQKQTSYASAKIVLPFLLEQFKIKSAIDFGCGAGTWLRAANEGGGRGHTGSGFWG